MFVGWYLTLPEGRSLSWIRLTHVEGWYPPVKCQRFFCTHSLGNPIDGGMTIAHHQTDSGHFPQKTLPYPDVRPTLDHIYHIDDHQASVTGIVYNPLNTHSTSLDPIWLVVSNMNFIIPVSWEFHHPNWRTHMFQRGRSTTNQYCYPSYPIIIHIKPYKNHIEAMSWPQKL